MLNIQSRIGLWAYQENNRIHWLWKKPWSQKLQEVYLSFVEWLVPSCWDKGCTNKGNPCLIRDYENDGDELIYWYCGEHSQKHGFCFACGEFWGGTESFDFGPGYCSNCASEFEEEEYDGPEWTYEE